MAEFCTRLAPSPTGALHLGNARTFLVNWLIARQRGWRIALRIDDLDSPRVRSGADRQALDDLRWLGLDWDSGPKYQSEHLTDYLRAAARLASQGDLFACDCTRSRIEASQQSAPHAGEHDLVYPGTCTPVQRKELSWDTWPDPGIAWRMRVPERPITFRDELLGDQAVDLATTVGDFIVVAKNGQPSYQLAVVVDDWLQGVTDVVRGEDLLNSTPRQLWIASRLGIQAPRRYWHLPLLVGADGRRLAKRHGDSRIAHFRELGVSPGRIRTVLGHWCGCALGEEATLDELLTAFQLERFPRETVVLDSRWAEQVF